MKKIILSLALSALLFGNIGCIKDTGCQNKSVDSERAAITAYATANNINATAHSSGIYYEIMAQGTGTTPNLSSKVFVTYTGKLLNNNQFDAGTTPAGGWVLSTLIQGWQLGLPLIQKGGRIKLIIPSSFGYGCQDNGPIPGNSVLFFDVTLNDVQ